MPQRLATQLALSALSLASRIGSHCDGRVLILKSHDRPGTYHRSQIDHVPVRQADAAVGLRFADSVGAGVPCIPYDGAV